MANMPADKFNLFQFPQLYVVEASAGSGKTYCLARRYLQLLINPTLKREEIPLGTILAITFTNKAAMEMKERILDLLKKIALDKFSSPEEKLRILDALGAGEEYARQKASRIMDYVLKNYNFFQVQTIDSFINTILSGCAFKLQLSANFTTERDYRQYLVLGLDKLIERAQEDEKVLGLFHNFLRQYMYLENRPGWFPKQHILAVITALYFKSAKFSGGFLTSPIRYADILSLKKDILRAMQEMRSRLPDGTHRNFLKALDSFLSENKESFDIEDISSFFKHEACPVNKGVVLSPGVRKAWQYLKERLEKLAEGESLFTYNYYIDIFNAVSADLETLAIRDNVLFLEALNKQAAGLFQEKGLNLPELYWRLATRFEHFLIDEFQDTSHLQWENLAPMVREALASSGSLFFVGDKKQAIYRFRGGEAGLIAAARQEFRKINFISEALAMNFRSQKEIVEFNNFIFSAANLKRFMEGIALDEEGQAVIMANFSSVEQGFLPAKTGGYVKIECLTANRGQAQAALAREKIIPLIKELTARFSPGDIAILVRKNEEAQLVSSWLLEEEIPVESETTLDIRQNAYIKELVCFLSFLNSPIDDLSFASFILGDIFSRASGMEKQKIRDFIFEFNHGGRKRTYLYREFRQFFGEAWDGLLDEFFKNVGFVPLYELTVSIFRKFRVFQEFGEYQGFFMGFLELIRRQEEERSSIWGFLEFYKSAESEELYVNSSANQAVRVLTIHKAKGLEFSVVVIPFLEINIKIDGEIVGREKDGIRLLYSKARYADFSSRLRRIRSQEYLQALSDELNAIYVASTRAADELYIFIPERGERGRNLACGLFPEGNRQSGKKTALPQGPARTTASVEIPLAEYKDWIGLLKDEFIEEGILSLRERVQKGEVAHYILSFIGNLEKQDEGPALERALQAARAQFPWISDFSEYATMVRNLLDKDKLRVFFAAKDTEVFTEYEIVNRSGDTKRIDRLLIGRNTAVVIDYKSDKDDSGRQKEQLREYMQLIQEIYPQLAVKGMIIYLDDLTAAEI
jgi:ATP-dependent exoDNAse (exonuclease V) beta subunit